MFHRVVHSKEQPFSKVIREETLEQALQAVFRDRLGRFRFSRSREVKDPESSVRHFAFQGQLWIAKVRTAEAARTEQQNAQRVASRLEGLVMDGFQVVPVVPLLAPLDSARVALAATDCGITLHSQDRAQLRLAPCQTLITGLMEALVAHGIDWRGFAPRNIIVDTAARRICLIDFEDVCLNPPFAPLRRSTLLKWQLNWAEAYHGDPAASPLLHRMSRLPRVSVTSFEALDRFEQTYAQICEHPAEAGYDAMLDTTDLVTLRAELPNHSTSQLTPLEVGHLLDDVLPPFLSVWSTCAIARLRHDHPHLAAGLYAALDSVVNADQPSRPLAFDMFEALVSAIPGPSGQVVPLRAALAKLASTGGIDAAFRRSALLDSLLVALDHAIRFAFPDVPARTLLLRGSSGGGLVSRASDIDFEYSAPDSPGGAEGRETLLSEMLTLLNLPCEGSRDRPMERDLIGADGHSRDANEFSQLRDPVQGGRPQWLAQVFPGGAQRWWQHLSEYEAAAEPQMRTDPGHLFKLTRATLARIAAALGCQDPLIRAQLDLLGQRLAPARYEEVRSTLAQSVALREAAQADSVSCDDLAKRIARLCRDFGVVDPVPVQLVSARRALG